MVSLSRNDAGPRNVRPVAPTWTRNAKTSHDEAARDGLQSAMLEAMQSHAPLVVMGVVFGLTAAVLPFAGGEMAASLVAFGGLFIAVATAHRAGRAEQKVAKLEEKLLDEHSYQVFIENATEGFFRTTREGSYLKVNPALARIYGYETPEQLASELSAVCLYVEPRRRAAFQDMMREHGSVADFVSEIRRRDGSVIWIAENARTVRDADGQFLFYEGTVEDITPRIKTEENLRQALKDSQDAARAKAAFLSSMSHELKTPLNAVIGFSDLILHETFGPLGEPRYKSYIGDIHDNGRRLLCMINDVLDLTRVEGGLLDMDEEPVSLKEIVEQAGETIPQMSAAHASISLNVAPNLPLLRADAKRVKQVIAHILSNAVKFTPSEGGISVHCWTAQDGALAVSVRDTGIGMAPERIAQALEPFKQLDNRLARRFEGVGIGLPLARALMQLHGGTLHIDSAPGKGTTVTAAFPPERTIAAPQAVPG